MVPFGCFPTGYEIEDGFGVTERVLRVIERIVENLKSFKDANNLFRGDYIIMSGYLMVNENKFIKCAYLNNQHQDKNKDQSSVKIGDIKRSTKSSDQGISTNNRSQ